MRPVTRRPAQRAAAAAQLLLWPGLVHLAAVTVAGALPTPPPPRPGRGGTLRLVVVVPAHDEQEGLPATLRSLAAAAPTRGGTSVLVVADHCTDGTADVARAAGVRVLERDGGSGGGKGAALAEAFALLLDGPEPPDAVAVVDADTEVDHGFWLLAEQRLLAGADVVQGRYLAAEPVRRTVVASLAQAAAACQSVLRPRGRARLGAAAKLQGNGMVFTAEVLREVPWEAFGVAEDVEHWFRLLRAGVRPVHEPSAGVRGAMPEDLAAARVQRTRWEQGRAAVSRTPRAPGSSRPRAPATPCWPRPSCPSSSCRRWPCSARGRPVRAP